MKVLAAYLASAALAPGIAAITVLGIGILTRRVALSRGSTEGYLVAIRQYPGTRGMFTNFVEAVARSFLALSVSASLFYLLHLRATLYLVLLIGTMFALWDLWWLRFGRRPWFQREGFREGKPELTRAIQANAVVRLAGDVMGCMVGTVLIIRGVFS